jgi:hypothetical protein
MPGSNLAGLDIQVVRNADRAPMRSWREWTAAAGAWCLLALMDVLILLCSFDRFHRVIGAWPVMPVRHRPLDAETVIRTCAAVNRARHVYVRHVRCLQRAAATTCYLRTTGYRAELVIGVRKIPFYAHAWAESDGIVVNDFPDVGTKYGEIARC